MSSIKQFSRDLRNNLTEAEKKLWRHLRQSQFHGLKFRRQEPVDGYIADFICLEKRIIIELDGGQHAEAEVYDQKRTSTIEAAGFKVLRFWNNDVLKNIEGVLSSLEIELQVPSQREGI